ncbi:hypothetical protein QF035_008957 [Streptomyces umbrinus]|uniref:Uncharacterized protein n=1 Tax=Streptomyces umbrinus TaxID=67370 RepID=A0ABU0T6E3_9ACTN|nr:hypothetical protein [Streptomyces umbrinus]
MSVDDITAALARALTSIAGPNTLPRRAAGPGTDSSRRRPGSEGPAGATPLDRK